ncbi:MAG: serine/threonine-protein kinase [Acidobacteriia bacterium]|nr:serine/threonine-protein kinase [Terriglobia bacterium]
MIEHKQAEGPSGTSFGRYQVVEHIGSGGMGAVYAAYDEKLQRKVALKSIRLERQLDEQARNRFLREARVLSQLGHPNICQIFDYLEGKEGDFLVLELIDGRNLSKAIRKGLPDGLKLRIAEQIASVLVAAHGKGVIHRDLKPDNVMLTQEDQVKVLDFGLSRQLGEEPALTPRSPSSEAISARTGSDQGPNVAEAVTEIEPAVPDSGSDSGLTTAGSILGTLGYMSPEQARGEPVTPASDMYSFGLLLQELFTEKAPVETESDVETRVERSRAREASPVSVLDPDLQALINRLKSLAPGARPSAEDTVQKLTWIREKPLRRRKKILLSVAATALMVFSLAMAVQSIRAGRAEKRAREEAEMAKQVSDFLTSIFNVSDPGETRGKTVTAREILDKGAKKVATELKGQPLVQARLMSTMGTVYTELGLYNDAEPLLSFALGVQEKALGPNHPDVAESLNNLASLHWFEGKYAEAESLYKRSLEIWEKTLGPDHPDVAKSLNNLALVYWNEGKYAEAVPLAKRSLDIWEKALGPEHPDVARSLNGLASIYSSQGQKEKAEPLFQRSAAIYEKALGSYYPGLAAPLVNLANLYCDEGRLTEAEPLYTRSLAIREKTLGQDHPDVAVSLNNLATLYCEEGKYAEAEPLCKRSLAIYEKALGPDHSHSR